MSFSEGFTQGFGMVDAALQRRNALASDKDKQALDELHYQDALKRQGLQDAQTQAWHKETSAVEAAKTHYQQGQDRQVNNRADKTLAAEIEDKKIARGLQAQANSLNAVQAQTQAAHYQKLNDKADFERQYLKDQNEKTKATERAQHFFIKDPSGGISLTIPTGRDGIKALSDIGTAYGLNVKKVAADVGQHLQDVDLLKSAMANEKVALSQQNLPVVIDALNRVEAVDIKQGSGLQADGVTTITAKKIVNIHDIDGSGNLVFEVESTGTQKNKNGKQVPYKNIAPMTQFRSSDPNDTVLKTVTRQQLMQRLDGQDALAKILTANPQFTQQIKAIYARTHESDKKDNYLKFDQTVTDAQGAETKSNIYVEPSTQKTLAINAQGQATQGVVAKTEASTAKETQLRQRVSLVLQHPDKFTQEQVDFANAFAQNNP